MNLNLIDMMLATAISHDICGSEIDCDFAHELMGLMEKKGLDSFQAVGVLVFLLATCIDQAIIEPEKQHPEFVVGCALAMDHIYHNLEDADPMH